MNQAAKLLAECNRLRADALAAWNRLPASDREYYKSFEKFSEHSVYIEPRRYQMHHAFGCASGMSRINYRVTNSNPANASVTFAVRSYTTNSNVSAQVSMADGEELLMKVAALYTRAHAQWIGANLMRSAFRKSGIAQWWGCFDADAYTIRDWNQTTGVIPAPVTFGGATNVCSGMVSLINMLRMRNEERRIALLFSDGSFSDEMSEEHLSGVTSLSMESRGDDRRNRRETTTIDQIKKAWSEGIEVYYIGLQVSDTDISRAEEMLGKGHAISIANIATDLPKVMEQIILMDEHNLKQTNKGKGFAIKK